MDRKINVSKVAQFTGHAGSIYALHVSAATGKVFTGGSDGYVIEWNLAAPEEGRLVCRLNQPVYCIYLNEENMQLWAGLASGNIHVVDLKDKAEIKNLEIHKSGVFDIKKIGNKIITAGGDGNLAEINAFDFTVNKINKVSEKSLRCISIGDEQKSIAVGSSDNSITLLNEELKLIEHKSSAHNNSVFSLAYTPDGQYLLSGGRDAMLKIWSLKNGLNLEIEIPAHNYHLHHISVQKEGEFFLTSSMDKTIKIWSLQDFKLLKVIDKDRNESHTNSVNKIAWLNEHEFISISDDKKMMHWMLNS